ncbi:MAG: pyrroline-5-carboxylate reductase [Eggerthellaceae bacterium]|nr:pyrroline-5-carboxylate reductase [Eggerthellaceae bacterium]
MTKDHMAGDRMPVACAPPLKLVFVGGGKMGEAIIGGWLRSDEEPAAGIVAADMTVVEPGAERRDYLSRSYGVACVSDAEQVLAADLVVLAVKPQVMMDVLAGISPLSAFSRALFVSIAAGLGTARLAPALPQGSRLVRVMPNTPLLVGEGASAVCASPTSTKADVEFVTALFACLGQAQAVGEDMMDAIGALSGSGPAYVAALLESLVRAAVEQGLDEGLAQRFAVQTALGTMILIDKTGQSPQSVREAVSSPGGSTLAALAAMDAAGMDAVYSEGIAAAVRRSKELGAC